MIQPQAASFQLPPAMSDTASRADDAYNLIFWFSVVAFAAIAALVIRFVTAHRRKPGVKAAPTGRVDKIQILGVAASTAFVAFLFHFSYSAYLRNAIAAEGATEIRVVANKSSVEFEYPNGTKMSDEVKVEVNKPYKLVVTSDDAVRSFSVPEFRLKSDAAPGQPSQIAFTPTVTGDAHLLTAEHRGVSQDGARATIKIVTAEAYREIMDGGKCQGTPEECGEKLFVKNGCASCHGAAGSGEFGPGAKTPGPKLAGIFGKPQPLANGESPVADEAYLRESIVTPSAKIVAGYTTVPMPPFALKDPQIDAMVAYIKSLK